MSAEKDEDSLEGELETRYASSDSDLKECLELLEKQAEQFNQSVADVNSRYLSLEMQQNKHFDEVQFNFNNITPV